MNDNILTSVDMRLMGTEEPHTPEGAMMLNQQPFFDCGRGCPFVLTAAHGRQAVHQCLRLCPLPVQCAASLRLLAVPSTYWWKGKEPEQEGG